MKIHCRKLLPTESAAYRKLRLESLQLYPESFGSNYGAQASREKLFFEKIIEGTFADKFVVGAFSQNKLIGIGGFFRNQGESNNHLGTIVQMYVKGNYQGKGIGQSLLQTIVSIAFRIEAIEQIDLSVITHQKQVHQVYEKVGFKEYGFRKNAMKDGDFYRDERFMVLHKEDYLKAE